MPSSLGPSVPFVPAAASVWHDPQVPVNTTSPSSAPAAGLSSATSCGPMNSMNTSAAARTQPTTSSVLSTPFSTAQRSGQPLLSMNQ